MHYSFFRLKTLHHILRNIFLFFIAFYIYSILFGATLTERSLISFAFFLIAYIPIYFLNDYEDRNEDKKVQKWNLYNLIENKSIFWGVCFVLLVIGFGYFVLHNVIVLYLLLILHILNAVYSHPPFRLRTKPFYREICVFFIYFVKWTSFGIIIDQTIQVPLLLFIMFGFEAAAVVAIYKRYIEESDSAELLFGGLFSISWMIAMAAYNSVDFFIQPLLPFFIGIMLSQHRKILLLGRYQLVYFAYASFVYFFIV